MTDDETPTLYDWAGGLPALVRMTSIFYGRHVPADPLLAPLFADMAPDHPERVAAWLGEVFGGPTSYSDVHGGYDRMVARHLGKGLTEEARARWVTLLSQSATEAGLPNDAEFRSAFASYLEWGSRLAVENSQPGAVPPAHMPMPRWDWGVAGPPGSRPPVRHEPAAASEMSEADAGRASSEADPTASLAVPATNEAVSFDVHIKPLFRASDRASMKWAFDLWEHTDVSMHAAPIGDRLRAGTMPCDGAWPPDRVALFDRWVAAGAPA